MPLQCQEIAEQMICLVCKLQASETIEIRNEIECEIRALEMVLAYYHQLESEQLESRLAFPKVAAA